MSVLSIDENFDPLFNRIWEIWPQSWGERSGDFGGKAYVQQFTRQMMDALAERGEYFHRAMNTTTVAASIWDRVIPKNVIDDVQALTNDLIAIIQRIDPRIKYIAIKYGSSISGGNKCIPDIEISFDTQWFGKDYNREDLGPWHERHSQCTVRIQYDHANIQGYQGSRPDAKPTPTFQDLCPECIHWKANRHQTFFDKDIIRQHIIFPEGEKFYVPKRRD